MRSNPRVLMAGLLSLLTLVGIALVLALSGPVNAEEADGSRQFIVVCNFDHAATVDPIVAPGANPWVDGHRHDFFGAIGVDENTTNASLQNASTNCGHPGDKAAYWAPALKVNGVWHRPDHLKAYYIRPPNRPVPTAFPSDFRYVAGDATAMTRQSSIQTYWRCKQPDHTYFSQPLPAGVVACPEEPGDDQLLVLTVNFPPCWNGETSDSPDHKSHVAQPFRDEDGRDMGCPSSHPVRLPTLNVHVHYRTQGGPDAELSSAASIWSGHADFMNGWDQQALQDQIQQCFVNDACADHQPYAHYRVTPQDEDVDGDDDHTGEILDINLSEPALVTSPSIGNRPAKVGRTLTAYGATATGNPTPTIRYTWLRCPNASTTSCPSVGTGGSYPLTLADFNSYIRLKANADSRTGVAGPLYSPSYLVGV